MQLVDDKRYDKRDCHRSHGNLILAQRLIRVQPVQDNEPGGKQHAHIVDYKPGCALVNILINNKDAAQKSRLHHIRNQYIDRFLDRINDHKCIQVNQKYEFRLSAQKPSLPFR